ncbi:MAG: PASTA domain-containing protein [Terriglobales bacterium]
MKRFLLPATTPTPLTKLAFTLLCCTVLMVFAAPAQTIQQMKADPYPVNDGPPAGAILDLSGTAIPSGGNETYQHYMVNFTASAANTVCSDGCFTQITFAFRDDPAQISFANASVVDTADETETNLLTNGNFSGGVYPNNGNNYTPIGWTYVNTYGAAVEPGPSGYVTSNSGYCYSIGDSTVSNCWFDGTVQAYDAISQAIPTTVGHIYQINFYVAEDSAIFATPSVAGSDGFPAGYLGSNCWLAAQESYSGPPCTFSDLSTNGDTIDPGGNGINVTVYAQAGLPSPNQQLTLTLAGLGTGTVTDNQGASGIGTCSEASGVVTQTPVATPPAATGTCSASYPIGTVVTLTASATSPSTFVGWSSTTGACSGSSAMCTFTINSAQKVTANFMLPSTSFTYSLSAGTNVTAIAAVACPSNPNPTPGNPCLDSNGLGAQLTIPQLPQSLEAMLTFTEIDPDGLCPAADFTANGSSGDFDCRFLYYSMQQGYGTDSNGNYITPFCVPSANGNCPVWSLTDQNGNELPVNSFGPQGAFLDFTWNNDTYTPTGYWLGSTPRVFIAPGWDEVTPLVPWGTNCSTPMVTEATSTSGTADPSSLTGYSTPVLPSIYCQFDADVTTYYNPLEPVDNGGGAKIPATGTDFVVVFKPTNVVTPASLDHAPMFTSPNTAAFTEGTVGVFSVTTTGGYPAPTLSIAAAPAWLTLSPVGLLSGTPPAGAVGSYSFTITATSNDPATGYNVSIPQSFTLTVGTVVPSVVGETQAAATSAITGVCLAVTVTTASSSTVPIGDVISQNPAGGILVSCGTGVSLVVSTGVAVPNVVGMTQSAATSAITGAGLKLGTVTTASSSTVPSGSVISESPAAGTLVNGGTAVNLVVSIGVFTITPIPSSETVNPGAIGGVILVLRSVEGFDATVTLSCGGGPAGFLCADLPMSVKLDGTALAVSGVLFAKTTPAGKYTITFTGTSGSIKNSATVQFTVK